MKIYYFAVASGSQIKTVNELKYPYILINHATKANSPNLPHKKLLFGDCGGFYSSFRYGGYTTTDEEYLAWVKKMKVDFFALRDYPCEPEVLKQYNRTVKEHIQMTLENHLSLLDLIAKEDIKATPVPVIQGWKLEDYLESIDLCRDYGLIKNYMAIGSVCRRGSQKAIEKIILGIKNNLPQGIKLHGFGLSLNAIKRKAVWDSLYSADSGAWDYRARWQKLRTGLSMREASEMEAKRYMETIEYLEKKMRYQVIIDKFISFGEVRAK